MILEQHVADVVDDHKIKMDAMRLKIRKIRKYAIHTVWINCYLGCDYDRICFHIEMFYIVSMYVLINQMIRRAICCQMRTMYVLWF